MATRSTISVEQPDGTWKTVYCHNDGSSKTTSNMQAIMDALRAFPELGGDEEITPESIRELARAHTDMVMNWMPWRNEIEFFDQDGKPRKIVYEDGDSSVGIQGGWTIPDDDWVVHEVTTAAVAD